jgi:chromate reductase
VVRVLDIVAFAGSLRADSCSRGLLRAAVELAPRDVALEVVELHEIPLFNQELEVPDLPEVVSQLRARVAIADAVLIATPEYNHTFPGVLGNTIEWLSRRRPTSPLRGKPVALMGVGRGGGSVRAQAALRIPFENIGATVLEEPTVAFHYISDRTTPRGDLVDPKDRQEVSDLVLALAGLARRQDSSEGATVPLETNS